MSYVEEQLFRFRQCQARQHGDTFNLFNPELYAA